MQYEKKNEMKCTFAYKSECGQSLHYASNVLCIPITKCDKPTSTHLRSLGCNSTDYELPEGLLILYRSGIFSIDCSSCDIYICPKHRDDFGIYWRRQTRKCQSPTHPDQSVAKPNRGIPASVCKELWMTKRISLPVGSDSECDFPLSSQSTQTFSQTTTSDWEEENMAPREIFNAAMKMLSRNFPALSSQLQLPWISLSKSSSSYYTKIITEAIQLIAQYVAPGQENNLLTDVCKKWISLKEDKPDTMTEALIASYQQQNNRLSQMQILSLFASKHTKERLMELVPGLSVFKIDAARRHATLTFPGQFINPPKVYRSRLSMPRVMHFIEFISCPTYHQAVGYGSKTLKLSSGLEITIPKVVRNVIASRLVSSYSQYCNDEGYECLGRSTLFNIVKACAASQKKNMHGLDNITSEGMRAIDILLKIVSKLEMFGLSSECVVKLKSLLDHVNQHLKFEMKGHVENKSKCAEHCSTYSLSDPTSKCFSDKCDHDHDQSCDDCSTTGVLDTVMLDAVSSVRNAIPADIQEEITHDLQISTLNLSTWKAHCIRTVHQEQARRDVLLQLKSHQCLIVMDWAMKFLPIKHRETQADFYGKKGIGWHISSVITTSQILGESPATHTDKFDVQTFVHILQLGTQGWFSVAHILTDLLNQLSVRTTVKEVFLKSDNAGCYHCAPLLSFIQHLNSCSSIKVLQYNFSEAQSGKDICDAKTAHCKMHMIRYSGEGHDIVTPQDMRAALHANGGVKGVLASVVSVDNQHERKMVSKIPNISQMNDITFHENGVTCRRAYKIGTGSFLPPNQFKDSATLTRFTVEEPFPILLNNKGSLKILSVRPEEQTIEEVPRNDGHETDQSISEPNHQLYPCPDMSCSKVYTKLCYLENHLCLGNHVYNSKKENQFDSIKKAWASQCVAVEREHKVLVRATAPSTVLVFNNEGWALKTSKSVKRFSTKVKDYISSIHQYFNATGKRPNFEDIAEELKTKRDDDGNKVFKQEEWLSPSQIRSLFSNFVRKNAQSIEIHTGTQKETKNDEDLQQAIAEIDALEYHADMINVALASENDFS
ncbi:uncharacterized protein LOC143075622 isoform X2 [Mytilus galloprovincialis]|uniref:uncharacterized protein LOC143075622 isoform X2 n=1 Tax=Mytilus galloprovincialis TaxID=29158 RepID=UPI003F7BF65E